MDQRSSPTIVRVVLALVGTILLVIVVGGVTEMLVGNDVAQWVRKTILLSASLIIGTWLASAWQARRSKRDP